MSRNDQLLVKEHKGKFYVFDVMAESWGEWKGKKFISRKNKLSIKDALGVFSRQEEAHEFAEKLDEKDAHYGYEYGVVDETLYKDGAEVEIVE